MDLVVVMDLVRHVSSCGPDPLAVVGQSWERRSRKAAAGVTMIGDIYSCRSVYVHPPGC